MNILTTENLAKYNTKNNTVGVGEWYVRNGVGAMDIRPAPFYRNFNDGNGNYYSYILKDELATASQWVFNLWIDGDDVIYSNKNVACGMSVVYTDSSVVNLTVIGGDGVGFQHKYYISDLAKTVSHASVYYYTSMPVFYRYDSYICPINYEAQLNKQGVMDANYYFETLETTNPAKIYKGGIVSADNFYEI